MVGHASFAQKVLGGAYKTEVQAMLSKAAGKAGKNHAHLRTADLTQCDQATADLLKIILSPSLFLPPFCASSDQQNVNDNCGPRHAENTAGKSGVTAACFDTHESWPAFSAACNNVTAAANVTAACKAALGIPCAATAEEVDPVCTYKESEMVESGFAKCSANHDEYDTFGDDCSIEDQATDCKNLNATVCVQASDTVMQSKVRLFFDHVCL